MKKINKKVWYAIAAVVVILIAWSFLRGGKKEEKVSFETAKVEKSDIHTSITATGSGEERSGDCRTRPYEPDQ